MIRINLLPHREAYRQKQIIEYIMIFLSATLLTVGLVVAVNMWATQDLTALQAEQASLKQQNTMLSRKIGELRNLDSLRRDVESKLQIVDELQAGRFRSLITLDTIAKVIPQNIWLTEIRDRSGSITMSGYGESSQAVANFMRALQNEILFDNVKLTFDEQARAEGADVRKFALTVRRLTLAEQEAKQKEKEGGQ